MRFEPLVFLRRRQRGPAHLKQAIARIWLQLSKSGHHTDRVVTQMRDCAMRLTKGGGMSERLLAAIGSRCRCHLVFTSSHPDFLIRLAEMRIIFTFTAMPTLMDLAAKFCSSTQTQK